MYIVFRSCHLHAHDTTCTTICIAGFSVRPHLPSSILVFHISVVRGSISLGDSCLDQGPSLLCLISNNNTPHPRDRCFRPLNTASSRPPPKVTPRRVGPLGRPSYPIPRAHEPINPSPKLFTLTCTVLENPVRRHGLWSSPGPKKQKTTAKHIQKLTVWPEF